MHDIGGTAAAVGRQSILSGHHCGLREPNGRDTDRSKGKIMNIPDDVLLDAVGHALAVGSEVDGDLVREAGGASCVAAPIGSEE